MVKKEIKVNIKKKKIKKVLDTDTLLINIREELLEDIIFPYIFLNADKEKISKEDESKIILGDVLDGRNLYLKKEKIKRTMLGEKVEPKNGLDFYVYPQIELSDIEKKRSSNFMVIRETVSENLYGLIVL